MRISKLATLAGMTVLGVGAAGVGYAYWTTDGAGVGSAVAGTVESISVVQTSAIAGLYPGGPPATLSGTFNNPNAGNVYISSVTGTLASVDQPADLGGKPACGVGDFTLAGSAPVNQEVGPGDAQGTWSGLTITLENTGANQDNCKNATLRLAYVANP